MHNKLTNKNKQDIYCYNSFFIKIKDKSNEDVFISITSNIYKKWLRGCINWTKENHNQNEQFVFIDACNEWTEGVYLGPAQRFGYAYLQATKDALEESVW